MILLLRCKYVHTFCVYLGFSTLLLMVLPPIVGTSAKWNDNIIHYWKSKIYFLRCENIYTNYIMKVMFWTIYSFLGKNPSISHILQLQKWHYTYSVALAAEEAADRRGCKDSGYIIQLKMRDPALHTYEVIYM